MDPRRRPSDLAPGSQREQLAQAKEEIEQLQTLVSDVVNKNQVLEADYKALQEYTNGLRDQHRKMNDELRDKRDLQLFSDRQDDFIQQLKNNLAEAENGERRWYETAMENERRYKGLDKRVADLTQHEAKLQSRIHHQRKDGNMGRNDNRSGKRGRGRDQRSPVRRSLAPGGRDRAARLRSPIRSERPLAERMSFPLPDRKRKRGGSADSASAGGRSPTSYKAMDPPRRAAGNELSGGLHSPAHGRDSFGSGRELFPLPAQPSFNKRGADSNEEVDDGKVHDSKRTRKGRE